MKRSSRIVERKRRLGVMPDREVATIALSTVLEGRGTGIAAVVPKGVVRDERGG
jgi:hypothetical protein